MLDLLAETIVTGLGFGVAVINIVRPDGNLQVASVAGDEDARATLLGTVDAAKTWDKLLAASEPWGRLRFLDHRNADAFADMMTWVPDLTMLDCDDAWHPDDGLFAPLIGSDGTRVGILSVDLPPGGRRPDATTCRALEGFAVSTALAIEHATLRARAEASENKLRERASYDSLTGVGNRSLFFERLGHALDTGPERRAMLALAFIDLDGFKRVNDEYSHAVGDDVLVAVAERLRSVVRPRDTLVRWGGDEFLVLFEHLDDEGDVVPIVERILYAVAQPSPEIGPDVAVSASIGVAFQGPHEELDADDLVRRADVAMYRAKRSGGGGFAIYQPVLEDDPR
ncbi:MAG TPA: GGDEF domain-containing protein [Nocardioidaceae bacterium]|nr:GGDEF domain-containing protein [Nocardioidaceae bacterium]